MKSIPNQTTNKSLINKVRYGGKLFELIRFVIVGGAATAVDLAVTFILYFIDKSLSENLITTCAFCVAFLVSYFGHRFFTFHEHGSIVKYWLLACSMLILRNIIVFILVKVWMDGLPPIILAMLMVTVITYLVSKYLVFKPKQEEKV